MTKAELGWEDDCARKMVSGRVQKRQSGMDDIPPPRDVRESGRARLRIHVRCNRS